MINHQYNSANTWWQLAIIQNWKDAAAFLSSTIKSNHTPDFNNFRDHNVLVISTNGTVNTNPNENCQNGNNDKNFNDF